MSFQSHRQLQLHDKKSGSRQHLVVRLSLRLDQFIARAAGVSAF